MTVASPYGTSVEAPGEQLPVGSLLAWHSNTPPARYLMCDGAQVPIASYPRLHAIVGIKYGALTDGSGGVGTSHFRLPDLSGKFLSTPSSNANIGVTGGTSSHQHTFTSQQGGATITGGVHNHNHTPGNLVAGGGHTHDGAYNTADSGSNTNILRATGGSTVRSFDTHTHTWSTTTTGSSHGHTINNTSVNTTGNYYEHPHTVTFQNAAATINDSPANVSHLPRHLAMNFVVYVGATP